MNSTIDSPRPQVILMAVLVCLFAVGMAGVLDFIRYRSAAEQLVTEWRLVGGNAVEYRIRSSMVFADLGALPDMLEREHATDDPALRHPEAQVGASTFAVARELALSALGVFVVAATLASLALSMVMHRIASDFEAVEAALQLAAPARLAEPVRKGPFGEALRRFFDNVRGAESEIGMLRGDLDHGVA